MGRSRHHGPLTVDMKRTTPTPEVAGSHDYRLISINMMVSNEICADL